MRLKDAFQILGHFGDAEHVVFALKDGYVFEGYIKEIHDDRVTCTAGGPLGGWSRTFPFEEIEPTSPTYWLGNQRMNIADWPTPWPEVPDIEDEAEAPVGDDPQHPAGERRR